MEPTDTVIQLLEDCFEDDSPVFTLAYVSGDLHVTPRRDPDAYPVTVKRDVIGYTVVYGAVSSGCATPELAAAAVHRVFGTAHLART